MKRWLLFTAFCVFLMAMVGAITRLTESGLSIVEWKPITGAIPPLNEAAWQHAFDLYKTSPQYKMINHGMSLGEFKQIFFWEWLHRLIGRLIGLVYALPLAYFWVKKKIPQNKKKPLLLILALGLAQGAMGWFMVKSGLVDQPAVSHYRLAAHLLLAFTLFCALIYTARDPQKAQVSKGAVISTFILAAITMTWGAFTAGLRAGHIYNDNFPFMGKHLWPSELMQGHFFEDHASVQFTHRVLAVLLLTHTAFMAKKYPAFRLVFAAVCVQAGLGIATLLTDVNIALATLHQAGAMTVLALLTLLIPKGTSR